MLENDIDDDDDIINPFNIISKPDDDTYVDSMRNIKIQNKDDYTNVEVGLGT
jgi:hypothetical protein